MDNQPLSIYKHAKHAIAQYESVDEVKDYIDKAAAVDMFSGALQDYYPVRRTVDEEEKLFYAKRQSLSNDDIDRIATRMEKASESLREHSDALRSYGNGRIAA